MIADSQEIDGIFKGGDSQSLGVFFPYYIPISCASYLTGLSEHIY